MLRDVLLFSGIVLCPAVALKKGRIIVTWSPAWPAYGRRPILLVRSVGLGRLPDVIGVACFVGIAVTHLLDLTDKLRDAPYMAALFCALIIASSCLAVMLALGIRTVQVWALGAALSAATVIGYVLSRSVGLPEIHDHVGRWLDADGIASLAVEGTLIVTALGVLGSRTGRRMLRNRRPLGPRAQLAVVAAATLATVGGLAGAAYAYGTSSPVSLTPFQVALPLPQVLQPTSTDTTTDYYTVTMKPGQRTIVPGTTTTFWGYNGTWPGPTIVAQQGRQVAVHVVNNLPESMSMHLHGGHTPSSSDGLPDALIATGASRDYIYPTGALTSRTLWYHDHAMNVTAPHVYKGLAGLFLIHDSAEAALNLPTGSNDVPLVIQDRSFASDGSLIENSNGTGNTIMVNGAPMPYLQVGARKVRFRVLNGSNSRFYALQLDNGQPMIQIGNEGGLLAAPVARTTIVLAPAERADVIIDFSKLPVGSHVVLRDGGSGWSGGHYSSWGSTSTSNQVMRFDVVRTETDTSTIPSTLRTIQRLDPATATVTRQFTFAGRSSWTINGNPYDPNRIDANVKLGSTEIWKFDNRSGDDHPIHVHLVNFQVLDVNGTKPSAPDDSWKETLIVPAWGTARIIAKFDDYTGTFVFHCHIVEHEDQGFMDQFSVVP